MNARGQCCSKCGSSAFGRWTSTSDGKVHVYCKPCRRVRAQNYSARKILNGGSHSQSEWEEKLHMYDRCPACGKRWEDIPRRPDPRYSKVWTKDHIHPLSAGGTDDIANIQPLCYRCNFIKNNKRPRGLVENNARPECPITDIMLSTKLAL